MQKNIHPNYEAVTITCSCGNVLQTRSTFGKTALSVEVCAKCHPFYTGQQKVIISDRVGKFEEKYKKYANRSSKPTATHSTKPTDTAKDS